MQLSSVIPNLGSSDSEASTMTPDEIKVPNEIKVIYLRCTQNEVRATSALAPRIGQGLPPNKVSDEIAKATAVGKV